VLVLALEQVQQQVLVLERQQELVRALEREQVLQPRAQWRRRR